MTKRLTVTPYVFKAVQNETGLRASSAQQNRKRSRARVVAEAILADLPDLPHVPPPASKRTRVAAGRTSFTSI